MHLTASFSFLSHTFKLLFFALFLFSCVDQEDLKKDSLTSLQNTTEEKKSSDTALTVYFSGNLQGYLDPCGCAQGQFGGLKRRANFAESAKGIFVENGDLTSRPEKLDQLKQEVVLKSFQEMNYKVINLGEKDLYLGLEPLHASPIVVISGNFLVRGEPVFPAFHEIEQPPFQLVIIGLLGESFRSEVQKIDENYDIASPKETLKKILEKIPSDRKIVLLFHGTRFEAAPLAVNFPQIEAIICAHEYNMLKEAQLIFPAGMYGKELGQLRWQTPKDAVEYQLVALNSPNLENTLVQKLMNEFYQKMRQEKNLIQPISNTYSNTKYVGSLQCSSCHSKEYKIWEKSLHFKAIPTLQAKKQDQNPDCLRCHTVGYGMPSGYLETTSAMAVPEKLGAVGCESCHGPGEKHLLDPKVSMSASPSSCLVCHQGENSPHFNFETYWPKIKH